VSGWLDIAAASRSELGQRKSNEDKVRLCREGGRWLAVLADGAGGHVGGAEASRRAVEALELALCDQAAEFTAAALTAAVLAAHDDVMAAQPLSHGAARMHSTVVVLWLDLDRAGALWSHVGDSRLYRVRQGEAVALTSDDSIVQRMVEARLITSEQAESHPQKNQLIAALGIEDGIEPHTIAAPAALLEGDAFLLCSDGWWDTFDLAGLAASLVRSSGPEEWLALMQQAIEARALPRQDNFSAIAVWVRDPIDSTRPMAMR
jgi:PPM family protein phosphatase